MTTRPLALAASVLACGATAAIAADDACALLMPAELEAAVGAKPVLSGGSLPNGVATCSGRAGAHAVMVRLFTRAGDAGGQKEKTGIEAARKMGLKVDVQKSGPITCVAMEGGGKFNTSCTAAKAPRFAVIEISGTQALPMERLRPVAEKMLGRF